MSTVDLVKVRLSWCGDVTVRPAPHHLRGAVADLFSENPLFHQHDGERLLYRYPQVQYRWNQDGPLILGLGEAARFLADMDWTGRQLRLGEQLLTIRDASCEFRRHQIQPADRLRRYRFAAPWLPFSQENYARYLRLPTNRQPAERDRLAVAGLLIALRGFGIDFPCRLFAAFEMRSSCPCRYKGVELFGFRGRLLANVDLPDGFALGRAVSHGYGWIEADAADDSRGEEAHDGAAIDDA